MLLLNHFIISPPGAPSERDHNFSSQHSRLLSLAPGPVPNLSPSTPLHPTLPSRYQLLRSSHKYPPLPLLLLLPGPASMQINSPLLPSPLLVQFLLSHHHLLQASGVMGTFSTHSLNPFPAHLPRKGVLTTCKSSHVVRTHNDLGPIPSTFCMLANVICPATL